MNTKLRILIVDNQPRARQSMQALLGAWYPKQEIREAASGTQAVELAAEFAPHIILMDARMPGLSGPEAAREIKAKFPRIKIVILSMYPDWEAEAMASGADAFVGKSDLPEKLRETLSELIGKGGRK